MMKILRYLLLIISLSWHNLALGNALYPSAKTSTRLALSDPQIKELSEELELAILESPDIITDVQANDYIQNLGDKLVQNTNSDENDFQFYILDSPQINAFAGPGGIVVVNTALILAADSESELAAVMAHEISHVTQNHIYRGLQRTKNYRIPMIASSLAAIALGVINPALAGGALAATMTGFTQDMISFTRSNEQEADRIGIRLLYESGFDPSAMADFFGKLHNSSRYYYDENIPPILLTHPLDQQRMADAQYRINAFPEKEYNNSLDYHLFKEQIKVLTTSSLPQLLRDYQRAAQSSHSDDLALAYGHSLALLKTRNYDKALETIKPLAENHPDNFNIQATLADIYAADKQTEKAKLQLAKLHKQSPENYPVVVKYADVLMNADEYHVATELLDQATKQFPDDPQIILLLAKAQAGEGKQAEAYFSRADALRLMGNNQQALNQYQHALELVDNDNRLLRARISARIDELELRS